MVNPQLKASVTPDIITRLQIAAKKDGASLSATVRKMLLVGLALQPIPD